MLLFVPCGIKVKKKKSGTFKQTNLTLVFRVVSVNSLKPCPSCFMYINTLYVNVFNQAVRSLFKLPLSTCLDLFSVCV